MSRNMWKLHNDKIYHHFCMHCPFFLRTRQGNMWHLTHDMWHVAHDTWHMTRDLWHMTQWGGGWTFSPNFSSLALTVSDLWYYEDMEEKADLVTEWISHEAVYRTALATPDLLKTRMQIFPARLKLRHPAGVPGQLCVLWSRLCGWFLSQPQHFSSLAQE